MKTVDLYGAEWCPDCRRAKAYLDAQGVSYNYIDISQDETAVVKVQQINKGKRIIPTIIIDGTPYANPNNRVLELEFGLKNKASE